MRMCTMSPEFSYETSFVNFTSLLAGYIGCEETCGGCLVYFPLHGLRYPQPCSAAKVLSFFATGGEHEAGSPTCTSH